MTPTDNEIPSWTPDGVLPPIGHDPTARDDRAPYPVSVVDFVTRFGTTDTRRTIISGFLRFRAELAKAGLVSGFQWINGSFLEHVEQIEGRSPRDIDVVTFFHLPKDATQDDLLQRAPWLTDHRDTEKRYSVDAYYVQLDADTPEYLIGHAAYWNSLWSHRKDGKWKGYLQIDLTSAHDSEATAYLAMKNTAGEDA